MPRTFERLVAGFEREDRSSWRVWLQVFASNERVWRAYPAGGFVEEGRQRRHVWRNGAYHDNELTVIIKGQRGEQRRSAP